MSFSIKRPQWKYCLVGERAPGRGEHCSKSPHCAITAKTRDLHHFTCEQMVNEKRVIKHIKEKVTATQAASLQVNQTIQLVD